MQADNNFPLSSGAAQDGYPGVDGWRAETRRGAIAICWPARAAPDDAGNTAV
jgi:hypothetical protein